jgi:protein involved in polysaccharide export with SLBB domain
MNVSHFSIGYNRRTGKTSLYGLLSFTVALIAFSCAPPPPQEEPVFDKAAAPAAITLMPGDVVDVKFYYTPEMNETQTIRPDGKISLQLLGDVEVSGKTPEQVRQELIAVYAKHLKEPDVVVILRTMNERRVYVAGEVARPGAIALPGSLTALEAVMEAGGFLANSAKTKNVIIIRRRGDTWHGRTIDLSGPLKGGDITLAELAPRDIVYVPRTAISKVDQWVDQHINKLIPEIVNTAAGSLIGAEVYRNITNTK